MNVNKLSNALDCIGYSGNTLSNEQWIMLQNSLTVLQSENHFKNIYLWGIIFGQDADYYIAYGYKKDALFGRKFFYSSNLTDFGLLPPSNETLRRTAELCTQRFQGDPALVVEVMDDDPGPSKEEIERMRLEACLAGGDGEIQLKQTPTILQIKEEDRLAATVEIINYEAVAIPRGVLFKHTDGKVAINNAFEGLTCEEAAELKSYVHYRKPEQKWNTNLLTRKDYNYALDFLDTIDIDLPRGCWSLQFERGGRLGILRSLAWPGFTSYNWTNTPDWGYFYMGNGRKNMDVPFMIYS